jgi:hypothetical protein
VAAPSLALPRAARVPWTALAPGSLLFAAGFQGFRLAVAAAELNACLWERRHAQFTPRG